MINEMSKGLKFKNKMESLASTMIITLIELIL